YLRRVGARYAQVDEVDAQIAEALARLNPGDETAKQKADQGRQQAKESAQAASEAGGSGDRTAFTPSNDLKQLYREVAKAVHPDLAGDEEERARRHRFMAEANQAYENSDYERLKEVLHEWEASPESVKGVGVGADLVRTVRKIAQAEGRLHAIEAEISAIKASESFTMKTKAEEAKSQGRDLIAEMAERLDAQIADAHQRLARINRQVKA
ncbi:MAG: J domain-containing protein, partial [Chloroflexi bacterium]|nr:J domain-containing protein [Chloroflexota bacterium]